MAVVPSPGQEGILRSHPDLAGRVAAAGALTAESTLEQRAAGLSQLTAEEKAELAELNGRCEGDTWLGGEGVAAGLGDPGLLWE